MPTQSVKLTDRYAKYVQRAVTQGRFIDVSAVVNTALRLLEEQDKQYKLKLKRLRRLVTQGFSEVEAGNYEVITEDTLDQFMDSVSAVKRRRKSA